MKKSLTILILLAVGIIGYLFYKSSKKGKQQATNNATLARLQAASRADHAAADSQNAALDQAAADYFCYNQA